MKMEYNPSKRWKIITDEERKLIAQWREKRMQYQKALTSCHEFFLHPFNCENLKSFLQNINFIVIFNALISVIAVAIFQASEVGFDVSVSLFVAPVVFPLAFLINSDFNRREKALEDLSTFKSAGLMWYFSMREWKRAAGLDTTWMNSVYRKLKNLSFHLSEYVLTNSAEKRKLILRALYEDFSDASLLVERVRASKLPINAAVVSRAISLLHTMSASMERLRVVREYRSPRSVRSFSRVFISLFAILLAPHFVYLGVKAKNDWAPYYVAIPVSILFSVLQGVQDKLDDPFDGVGEDDINLETIEDWSLDAFGYKVPNGKLQNGSVPSSRDLGRQMLDPYGTESSYEHCGNIWRTPLYNNADSKPLNYHKYAPMFDGIKSITRIAKQSIHKTYSEFIEDRMTNIPITGPTKKQKISTRSDFSDENLHRGSYVKSNNSFLRTPSPSNVDIESVSNHSNRSERSQFSNDRKENDPSSNRSHSSANNHANKNDFQRNAINDDIKNNHSNHSNHSDSSNHDYNKNRSQTNESKNENKTFSGENFLNSVEIEFSNDPISVDTPQKDVYGAPVVPARTESSPPLRTDETSNNKEIPDFIGHIKKFYSPYPITTDYKSTENTCWI